ncbi:hypothetical protein J6590_079196 [Homalodisca vitripennis]|nr:hypothetical protein J6590_079196 [Homalodisca vitripennis]
MEFSLEKTKTGKPCILYNDNKYRQYRILKNGQISWRCLGRNCGASLKTDPDIKSVIVSGRRHTGPHPPASTPTNWSSTPTSTVSISVSTATASPPVAMSLALSPERTPLSSLVSATLSPDVTMAASSSVLSPSTSTDTPSPIGTNDMDSIPAASMPLIRELIVENARLKEEIAQLKTERSDLLNHLIQSDTRLLQYTDQIFVANVSDSDAKSSADESRRTFADFGVQCELTPDLTKSTVCTVEKSDFSVQCNFLTELAQETDELICSLRTTVEVLEAKVQCLGGKQKPTSCTSEKEKPWVEVKGKERNKSKHLKTQQNQKQTKNFNRLNNFTVGKTYGTRKNKNIITPKNTYQQPSSTSDNLSKVKSVTIEGDSHARHIAGLLAKQVGPATIVREFRKPGAKFLEVTATNTPPSDCLVLIAGANDVAAGEQRNIYRHLEERIVSKPSEGRLIVATLPHRHDLPVNHAINEEVVLVNAYIEELAIRHNIQVLDFNKISRRYFTRHSLHLTMRSKWLLAKLIAETLCKLAVDIPLHQGWTTQSSRQRPLTPADRRRRPSRDRPPPILRTMAYDTFAEAVKSQRPADLYYSDNSGQNNCQFLTNAKEG